MCLDVNPIVNNMSYYKLFSYRRIDCFCDQYRVSQIFSPIQYPQNLAVTLMLVFGIVDLSVFVGIHEYYC